MKKTTQEIVRRTRGWDNGGAGGDIFIYNVGDGVDTIYDAKADNNILCLGAGVNKDNIKLRLGSLMLDLGNGDAVHVLIGDAVNDSEWRVAA